MSVKARKKCVAAPERGINLIEIAGHLRDLVRLEPLPPGGVLPSDWRFERELHLVTDLLTALSSQRGVLERAPTLCAEVNRGVAGLRHVDLPKIVAEVAASKTGVWEAPPPGAPPEGSPITERRVVVVVDDLAIDCPLDDARLVDIAREIEAAVQPRELTHTERKAWAALDHRKLTSPELGKEIGVGPEQARRVVAGLRDKGRAVESDSRGSWRPDAPPARV